MTPEFQQKFETVLTAFGMYARGACLLRYLGAATVWTTLTGSGAVGCGVLAQLT